MREQSIAKKRWRIGAVVLAAVVFYVVLVQPNHPHAMTVGALFVFPLELPAILLGLLAVGRGRFATVARAALVLALSAIVTWKVADAIMFTALNRAFNPLTDMSLVTAFLNLISGTFGGWAAVLASIASVLVTGLVVCGLWWATGVWTGLRTRGRLRGLCTGGALLFAGIAAGEVGHTMRHWTLPTVPPGAAFTARFGVERVGIVQRTVANMRDFRAAAANDVYADQDGLLDLIDRDVFVIYVESYGRTSFDTPQYSDIHLETVRAAEASFNRLGLSMASSFIASPTRGGQSWLAHSTLANGLWITDQPSYGAALGSNRRSLFHIAQDAGFHTAAVMPQITLAWPEVETMGFDTVLVAADLGYEGVPFNWVTMPDQFTLRAMDRLLPAASDASGPHFVQVALGSSHAPWVPVPELVDWDSIGNGKIYDSVVAASDTPETIWKSHDRVRTQYGLALDYALQTVFSYVALHASNPPLVLVIGDHQAAGFVALDERPDVPVHVIGPAHLVDRLAAQGFHNGLVPPADVDVRTMDRMRDLLVQVFSSEAPQAEGL